MLLNNEIITLENIKLIKDSAAPVIMMNNTKGQDPEIIKRIPKNIDVKVLGGYNFCEDVKYLKPKYVERTYYSPQILAEAITVMQEIEEEIDPNWSDFLKALFVFEKLVETIDYDYDNKSEHEDRNLTSFVTGLARCAGFSICFKEMMDRLGIKCEFRNVPNTHSYNVLFYKGQPFVVDVTWAKNALDEREKDYYRYFGAFDARKHVVSHIHPKDKTNYKVFWPKTIKKCLEKIEVEPIKILKK